MLSDDLPISAAGTLNPKFLSSFFLGTPTIYGPHTYSDRYAASLHRWDAAVERD
jgi:hypothetical protein